MSRGGRLRVHGGLLLDSFRLHDAEGIPLSLQVELEPRPSLPHFMADAFVHGWTAEQTVLVVEEALGRGSAEARAFARLFGAQGLLGGG